MKDNFKVSVNININKSIFNCIADDSYIFKKKLKMLNRNKVIIG